jgi:hypothetical protein
MVLVMLVLGRARNRQVGLFISFFLTCLRRSKQLTCTCGHVLESLIRQCLPQQLSLGFITPSRCIGYLLPAAHQFNSRDPIRGTYSSRIYTLLQVERSTTCRRPEGNSYHISFAFREIFSAYSIPKQLLQRNNGVLR